MANALTLSSYIISLAGAASIAQKEMSTLADPMTIAQYTFKVNITSDFEVKSETDVALNVWRVNLKEKLSMDYKEHIGITVECTIKPAAVLAAGSGSGGGGGISGESI